MEFGLSPIPGFLFLCPFLRFGSARTQFPAAPNFFYFQPLLLRGVCCPAFSSELLFLLSELFFFLLGCCLPSEVSGALLPFSFAFFPRLLSRAPSSCTPSSCTPSSCTPSSCTPSFLTPSSPRALFPARLFFAPPFPCALFPVRSLSALSFPRALFPACPLSRAPSFPCALFPRSLSRAPLSARPLFARLAPSFPAYTLPGLNPLPSLSILQPAPRLNGTAADGTVRNGVLMSAQSFSVPLQAHPGRFMLPNC